jgi:hypothetical protein
MEGQCEVQTSQLLLQFHLQLQLRQVHSHFNERKETQLPFLKVNTPNFVSSNLFEAFFHTKQLSRSLHSLFLLSEEHVQWYQKLVWMLLQTHWTSYYCLVVSNGFKEDLRHLAKLAIIDWGMPTYEVDLSQFHLLLCGSLFRVTG